RFGMAGRKNLAVQRTLQHPFERLVSGSPQVRGHPNPVEVHVYRQRGRRSVISEPSLFPRNRRKAHPWSAQLPRHPDREVSGVAKLLKVFGEKTVFTVVAGCPF